MLVFEEESRKHMPCIMQADTMTPEELEAYRIDIAHALSESGVTIHTFTDDEVAGAGELTPLTRGFGNQDSG
jgi:hypothetical protein